MKKILCLLTALFLFASICACGNQAIQTPKTESYVDTLYEVDETTGEYGITFISDFYVEEEMAELIISAENEDKKATFIGKNAGLGLTKVTTIIIQEGIKEIREGAFAETIIEKIVIPSSITYISPDAFQGAKISFIEYLGNREKWNNWNIKLPIDCILKTADDTQDATKITEDNQEILSSNVSKADRNLTPEDMKTDYMYVLDKDGMITEIVDNINYERGSALGHIDSYDYENIPTISKNDKLIIRSNIRDAHIHMDKIDFTDKYINRNYCFNFTNKGVYIYEKGFNGVSGEVDNIDGNKNVNSPENFPLQQGIGHVNEDSYYFYSIGSPKTFTVGYFVGTQYNEVKVLTSWRKFTIDSNFDGIKCQVQKTYDGYGIVDISSLPSGFYSTSGFRDDGIIYIE